MKAYIKGQKHKVILRIMCLNIVVAMMAAVAVPVLPSYVAEAQSVGPRKKTSSTRKPASFNLFKRQKQAQQQSANRSKSAHDSNRNAIAQSEAVQVNTTAYVENNPPPRTRQASSGGGGGGGSLFGFDPRNISFNSNLRRVGDLLGKAPDALVKAGNSKYLDNTIVGNVFTGVGNNQVVRNSASTISNTIKNPGGTLSAATSRPSSSGESSSPKSQTNTPAKRSSTGTVVGRTENGRDVYAANDPQRGGVTKTHRVEQLEKIWSKHGDKVLSGSVFKRPGS